ncbi:MAG: hypothetical protein LBS54_06860 [Dysgonamonadaceae bacterium]|jgi:hypothetical protein|nr:hypothetical protein [Dysgonamonadaceae bacterium]
MRNFLLLFALAYAFFYACDDGLNDISYNPNDILSFSTDTVSFDTVLTAVNSPVKFFRFYNRNNRNLTVSSITTEHGADSPFKINIDGFAGSAFENLELRAGDSVYVMVNVKPSESGENNIVRISDRIVFVTNGINQFVELEAYGQDAFHCKDIFIDRDTTLSAIKPYLIHGKFTIGEGVSAVIPAGSVFFMNNDAEFIVEGNVMMLGEEGNPIVFRGSRTDYLPLAKPLQYDLIPNQWGGIRFSAGSYGNVIDNVRIRNGRYGLDFLPSTTAQKKAVLRNTVVTNAPGCLLSAVNCDISAENCEFSNSGDINLRLSGGAYQFIHCTVANYYPTFPEAGWKKSAHRLVMLSNSATLDNETVVLPLESADFYNTVLASVRKDSVILAAVAEKASFNYKLMNCLLTDKFFEDEKVAGCVFDAHPDSIFVDCKGSDAAGEDFLFDFSLKESSPARNAANPGFSQAAPLDIRGNSRLEDGFPDIGAYEWVRK